MKCVWILGIIDASFTDVVVNYGAQFRKQTISIRYNFDGYTMVSGL